jgi:crotonobetaine/carnitine-CoA ligase
MADGDFGMPERTLASRRNLWFQTGDIGRMDADGLFCFMHRVGERIRVMGEMGEEDIKAFVTFKAGAILTAAQIRTHCAARMAKFMVPKHAVVLDEMPRTPTSKPEKGKLAALSHLRRGPRRAAAARRTGPAFPHGHIGEETMSSNHR